VSDRPRTILAMGGGGFTMEPDNPLLDDFVLSLAPVREPRVLFLPTASGDAAGQIAAYQDRFGDRACVAGHLSLFRLHGSGRTLREIVLEQDVVYIGGGSMRNLLAIWRAHGLDAVLAEAWERGIVLAGLSAGAMCWFEGGITRSSGPPERIDGLGLLPGSLTVHADGEPERLPAFVAAVRSGALPGGWAADDGAGLLFRGTGWSARCPPARARARGATTRSRARSSAAGSSASCWARRPARRRPARTCWSCAHCCACGTDRARVAGPPRKGAQH
jgi:peptidase E